MPEETITRLRRRAAEALRLSQDLKEPKAVQVLREIAADLHAEADKLEAKSANRDGRIFFVQDEA